MARVIDRRYQAALATLRARAAGGVERAWDSLDSYNEEDVPAFLERALPIVGGAQRQAVNLTEAYLARVLHGAIYGLLAGAGVAALTGAGVRNGSSPDAVYRRSFVTVWTALSNGTPWADAVASGLARATATAQTDVALSTRAAATAYAAHDDRIIGWQRVTDDGACDLCEAAADQTYRSEDLMPLHDRCGCTVEPITGSGGSSPSFGPLESDVAAVHDHGELGPVLTAAGDHFDGKPPDWQPADDLGLEF